MERPEALVGGVDFREEESTSGRNIAIVALGATALAARPLAPAIAQSGDALAHAEYICSNHGVPHNMPQFDTCVGRAAFDQGRPALAERQVSLVGNADKLCRSYGIGPETMGYRECLNEEITRRAPSHPVRYMPVPRASTGIDAFGFHYDSDGSPIDRYGYPVGRMP